MDAVEERWQRTRRLRLRPPERDDADAVRRLRQDAAVMRYLGGAVDDAEARLRFARDLRHWDEHGYGLCVVEAGGAFAGLAGLRHFEGDPDLSYLLVRERWGEGLATEAAGACLAWGFDVLGADLVRAMTDPGHRASQRVLTKAGLRYAGERVLWGSRQRCYVMTPGEWALRQPESRAEPRPGARPGRYGRTDPAADPRRTPDELDVRGRGLRHIGSRLTRRRRARSDPYGVGDG